MPAVRVRRGLLWERVHLRNTVRKIRRTHDALAPGFATHERKHGFHHIRCIQHPIVAEPLCRQEARVVPVASIKLTVAPRHFAILQVVHNQTGQTQGRKIAANFQITYVDSGFPLMPTEEALAQMLSEPHMTHEAFGLRRHVCGWSNHDNTLGVPFLSLCERQRSAAERMSDSQRSNAVTTPDRMDRVDEIRKGAQLADAATMRLVINRDLGLTRSAKLGILWQETNSNSRPTMHEMFVRFPKKVAPH